jgi:hypothetical protein
VGNSVYIFSCYSDQTICWHMLHMFLLLTVFPKFVSIVCISGKFLLCYANQWSSLITSILYFGRVQYSQSFRSVGLLTTLRNLNSVHVSSLVCSPELFLNVPFVYYHSINIAKCLHVFCQLLYSYSLQIHVLRFKLARDFPFKYCANTTYIIAIFMEVIPLCLLLNKQHLFRLPQHKFILIHLVTLTILG